MVGFYTLAASFLLGTSLAQLIPLAPDIDPFYDPPAGFENEEPGTILAQRTFIPSFLGLIPDPVKGYQLLYRTTAANGSAIAAVTSIFVPATPQTDKFVSFHTAYDSSATICNPSYNYQLLAVQADLISSLEMLLLQGFLLGNYIVSSPDYEGPDAAFGAGRLAGTGVLDSMRAVSNFHATLGLSTSSPKIVGAGYSGGAIATGWAASLASTYAPELPIVGWSMGGTPANLTGTAVFIDDTSFSGFLPPSIAGLRKPSAYGAEIGPVIDSIITDYGRYLVSFAETFCAPADLINFFQQSIFDTRVQSLGRGLFYEPTIARILANQTMGVQRNEYPRAPVYLYHATQDEIIPYSNASTLVNAWCADGASVNFITYAAGGHLSTEIIGFPDAYNFVNAAFAGTVASGCSASSELTDPANPIAVVADLEPILTGLLELLDITGIEDQNVQSNVSLVNDTQVFTPSSQKGTVIVDKA